MSADPLEHVARVPLPWQTDEGLTECGRSLNDVAAAITRTEMVAKVKREGQARAATTSCMTCWSTTNRHETWDKNPASAVTRVYSGSAWRSPNPVHLRELRALAELVAHHRDEFDAIVEALDNVTDLSARRGRR